MVTDRSVLNYVGSERLASETVDYLEVANLVTGELLATASFSLVSEMDQAAKAANEAFGD